MKFNEFISLYKKFKFLAINKEFRYGEAHYRKVTEYVSSFTHGKVNALNIKTGNEIYVPDNVFIIEIPTEET